MTTVRVGLLGLGTVASSVVNLLRQNADEIRRRVGHDIHIQQVAVRDLDKARECSTEGLLLTNDPMAVVNDPEIDIVIELIGGEELAKTLILTALEQKKHVITANKRLIALQGHELFACAERYGVMLAFEAAVAGGIPIIKAIREGLAANHIQSITGIINGTSNYILSQMHTTASEFATALADAQRLGYAEADPEHDIEGIDAAHKLTILASIAFGIPLDPSQIAIEGISHVTHQDIAYAKQFGYCIKHLGIAKKTPEGLELRVHPTLIPRQHTLAHISGVLNALLVDGDAAGPTLYSGAGAGGPATASAVVADLLDVLRGMGMAPQNRLPYLAFQSTAIEPLPLVPVSEMEVVYYLRIMAAARSGMLAQITHIFSELDISIESILQKKSEREGGYVPIVIISQQVKEKFMDKAIEKIEQLEGTHERVVRLRLEPLEK